MSKWLDRCHFGDCRDTMRAMIADGVKVQTIVTSPPYWGLRDYGGVAGQIGHEPTLREFIDTLVGVFELCRELLAEDGTAWVNMGDSYCGNRGAAWGPSVASTHARATVKSRRRDDEPIPRSDVRVEGLKPKDLVGQPWRLAFALRDAGWYLRQDIIWHKPNPMPESMRDRCTKAHEYLFLLSKSEKYYFDQDAILEPVSATTAVRLSQNVDAQVGSERANGGGKTNGNMKAVARGVGWGHGTDAEQRGRGRVTTKEASEKDGGRLEQGLRPAARMGGGAGWREQGRPLDRNKRSVWTVPTQSYSGAHFATFPEKLVEPCVLAGSRVGDVVFDPFFGSGTTGQVAQKLGRQFVGCELNPAYGGLQDERLRQPSLILA
jgi:site-specific DNA-methyltransferase (cytosine-N4-specific)